MGEEEKAGAVTDLGDALEWALDGLHGEEADAIYRAVDRRVLLGRAELVSSLMKLFDAVVEQRGPAAFRAHLDALLDGLNREVDELDKEDGGESAADSKG